MSRLIDADALMEEINSLSVTVTGASIEMKEAMKHCRESAVRIIEEQPTVGEWIPVEERLPEDNTAVLATVRHRRWICDYDLGESEWTNHPEYCEVCTVYRDGDEYCKMDDSDYDNITYVPVAEQKENIAYPIEEVVAWMPLPEQYKKESKTEYDQVPEWKQRVLNTFLGGR